MSHDPLHSFSDIFSEVLENRRKDPVQHILVLTYEFDDLQLLNLVCGRDLESDFELKQTQLQILSDMRPVIIYDARKTKEFSRLPQFLELHPYKTKSFSCHHSKAYFIVTQKTARLVLGSFNLTGTGLFKNREVFEYFYWDVNTLDQVNILNSWIQFLNNYYKNRLKESSASALNAILNTMTLRLNGAWKSEKKSNAQLLFSGYGDVTGFSQMQKVWKNNFPDEKPNSIFVVSPFFDINPKRKCIAGDFKKEFPEIDNIAIITDEKVVGNLSKAHFGEIENCSLFQIRKELGKKEKKEIIKHSEFCIKDQEIDRNLHAKILILKNEDNVLVYMGSANFSQKAWMGDNNELGLIWVEPNVEQLQKNILKYLNVTQEDIYSKLPALPPETLPEVDDEDYEIESFFPDFIEQILLVLNEDQSEFCFQFEIGKRTGDRTAHSFNDYTIKWAGISLTIEKNRSQAILQKEFNARIISGRNLRFVYKKELEKSYWFPFQYTGKLIDERNAYIHPTSWDWMSYYLNKNSNILVNPGESVPGDDGNGQKRYEYEMQDVRREENIVIAMQTYLNLFQKIEDEFMEKAEAYKDMDEINQEKFLLQTIIKPLNTFAKLLFKETQTKKSMFSDSIFKTGELLVFIKTLREDFEDKHHPLFNEVTTYIETSLEKWKGQHDSIHKEYIDFALGEGINK